MSVGMKEGELDERTFILEANATHHSKNEAITYHEEKSRLLPLEFAPLGNTPTMRYQSI